VAGCAGATRGALGAGGSAAAGATLGADAGEGAGGEPTGARAAITT